MLDVVRIQKSGYSFPHISLQDFAARTRIRSRVDFGGLLPFLIAFSAAKETSHRHTYVVPDKDLELV